MKNVRLYARVSTEEQRKKDLSVPAQIKKLEEYCTDNNLNIVGTYIDNGISAATIVKRKGFCQMLDELQQDDIILITRLDRMSRNVLDSNKLLEKFAPLNVTFKAISEEDVDVTTADGKFMFDLKVSLAERERKKTSERIKDVFAYKLSKGELITGRLPRGYKREGNKAVIVKDDAKFIQDVFDTFEEVRQIRTITRILNDKYKFDLTSKTYRRILKKTEYIGLYRDLNIFPPIISNEQFERVQRILGGNTIKVTKQRIYIFAGLIRCKQCGMKLGGTTTNGSSGSNRKFKLYKCPKCQSGKGAHQCISEKKLEKKLLPLIMSTFENRICELSAYEVEIEQNKDTIKNTEEKIRRLQELYIDGKISKDVFDNKYTSLTKIINEEMQKTDINKIASIKNNYKKLIKMNIHEIYKTLDDKGKSSFWHSFIDYIIVDDYDNINIFLIE